VSNRLGLDWWDVIIHVFVTVCAAVAVSTLGPPGGGEEVLVSTVFATSAVVFGVRRRIALKRSPEVTTGEVAGFRLDELEQRVADLEGQGARLAELEERMDFSERLLVKGDAARFSSGGRSDQKEHA
jgi:hypothetical protein